MFEKVLKKETQIINKKTEEKDATLQLFNLNISVNSEKFKRGFKRNRSGLRGLSHAQCPTSRDAIGIPHGEFMKREFSPDVVPVWRYSELGTPWIGVHTDIIEGIGSSQPAGKIRIS